MAAEKPAGTQGPEGAQGAQPGPYQPKDALRKSLNATFWVGGAGLIKAAVSNSLARENVGAMGVFTRSGGTIVSFALSGAFYGFGTTATANLREKDDWINDAVGGFLGGSVMGMTYRTMPKVLGLGTLYGTVLGAYVFTGGSLSGPKRDPNHDEFAEKMRIRANRRRPIQETVDELGEGRGIYAPGYPERRRQRLKENYGIDVPTKFPPARPVD